MESLMPAYQSAGVIVAVITWDLCIGVMRETHAPKGG